MLKLEAHQRQKTKDLFAKTGEGLKERKEIKIAKKG
jgi:hypothetical protein